MDFDNRNSSYEDRQKQEDNKRKMRRVYSTASIEQLIKDSQMGYDIDYGPFFMKDLDLRAPGVTFRMTDEELEEYYKCYDDPIYYVKKYCRFMTDKGLKTVELRDFQERVISTVTEERYIEKNDDMGPKNRSVIWMASRQSGKCHLFNTIIESINEFKKIKYCMISDLYDTHSNNSILLKIKKILYKIYNIM